MQNVQQNNEPITMTSQQLTRRHKHSLIVAVMTVQLVSSVIHAVTG